MPSITPSPTPGQAGGRRHRVTVKAMKSALKKAGLKTTGKKATLSRRVKKAHLKVGGQLGEAVQKTGEAATALVKAPIEGVKAALDGRGRRR